MQSPARQRPTDPLAELIREEPSSEIFDVVTARRELQGRDAVAVTNDFRRHHTVSVCDASEIGAPRPTIGDPGGWIRLIRHLIPAGRGGVSRPRSQRDSSACTGERGVSIRSDRRCLARRVPRQAGTAIVIVHGIPQTSTTGSPAAPHSRSHRRPRAESYGLKPTGTVRMPTPSCRSTPSCHVPPVTSFVPRLNM
jgi:hypothetical protein